MNKVKEILLSYMTAMNPTEEQKEVAEKRLEICNTCEFWVSGAVRDYCSVCGCTTSKKVFSPVGSGACPKGKWTEWWKKVDNIGKYNWILVIFGKKLTWDITL